ncbi:ZIP zinc transporter-domain-containing protein [Fimicolochytrium jonesii]|uniref:ZIP zinc transporter-domain-containing protein n=1 Tax=Fimicolochytrium jonesii TaxID=1396493 RepID=UPI0022FE6248|nr:ZIP zinc transporter-domain-containing protein [Fimicolochytrium jonesii]KAI8825304.1 ZIP zinc transporter-domain-containing protein [Fimicolochytrium jonesii]
MTGSNETALQGVLLDALTPYLPPYILTLLSDKYILAFTISLIASMGTFLGGIIVCVLAKATGADPRSKATAKLMGVLEAFSAGVMMYITCFDLIPEAVESIGSREAMFWFFGGVAVFGVLEEVIMPSHDHDEEDGHDHEHEKTVKGSPKGKKGGKNNVNSKGEKTDSSTTTTTAEPALSAKERRDLLRSSLITFVALAMHNLPEGLGVYLAALSDLRLGTQLAVAILIHNIPEGMAVAVPLYAATGNTTSVLWWTLLNGLAEPLGVVAGGWLLHGYLSPQLLSRCLAGVGGIMACISIHELQPTAIRYSGKTIATSAFFGGMVVCFGALEAVNEWFGGHAH